MGYKQDHEGVWRSEQEIQARQSNSFLIGCFAVVCIVIFYIVYSVLQFLGIIKSKPENKPAKNKIVEVLPANAPQTHTEFKQKEHSIVEETKNQPLNSAAKINKGNPLSSESEAAIIDALAVFKDGTLDEAKVVVSRLESTATQYSDDHTILLLRDHILAVFRAEYAISVIQGKITSADQLTAQLMEELRIVARKGGEPLDVVQIALEDARKQKSNLMSEMKAAKPKLLYELGLAQEFCRKVGFEVEHFSDVLQKIQLRWR